MNSSIGSQIAVSLVAVIGVPVLVGQVAAAPAEAPAPAKSALTVQLTGAEQTSGDSGRILVQASGLPPGAASSLNSTDGLQTTEASATAKSAAGTECDGLPAHHATSAPGGEPWCVSLRGIPGGSSVAGTLGGAKTELTLTVNRRVDFFWIPLLIVVAGLIAGGLIVLVPKLLRGATRKALLENQLDENDVAPDQDRIEDLRDWVKDQRDKKKTDDELLPTVADMVRRGPRLAEEARAELSRRLSASNLPPGQAARAAAIIEASRAMRCADFIDADGKPTTHPARLLAGVITQLESLKPVLEALGKKIDDLPESKRAKASEALKAAQARFETAEKPEHVTKLQDLIDETRQAIAAAGGVPSSAFFAMAGPAKAMLGTTIGSLILGLGPAAEKRGLGSLLKRFAVPLLGTAGVLIVTAVWAVLTIKLTVYDAKPAFGSGDYLSLLVAAVGSGAAGSILGIVSAWNPLSPAVTE